MRNYMNSCKLKRSSDKQICSKKEPQKLVDEKFGAVRQYAATFANVDPERCCHTEPLGQNELMSRTNLIS